MLIETPESPFTLRLCNDICCQQMDSMQLCGSIYIMCERSKVPPTQTIAVKVTWALFTANICNCSSCKLYH